MGVGVYTPALALNAGEFFKLMLIARKVIVVV